jgi:hypothetical protein
MDTKDDAKNKKQPKLVQPVNVQLNMLPSPMHQARTGNKANREFVRVPRRLPQQPDEPVPPPPPPPLPNPPVASETDMQT